MGWTWQNAIEYKNGKIDKKREYERGFNTDKYEVLKSVIKGQCYYGAIKNKDTGVVFPLFTLIKTNMRDYYNFGYKDICDYGTDLKGCPDSVLKLCTPEDEYEQNIVKKCYEYNEREKAKKTDKNALKNLPYGSLIKFDDYRNSYYILEKMAPAYQFKTYWFRIEEFNNCKVYCDKYYSKKQIPDNYEVIRRGYEEKRQHRGV